MQPGGEEGKQGGGDATMMGSLHKRRVNTSPEKFDKGRFEKLPLKLEHPPAKKAKTCDKLEVTYDADGTPHLTSFPLHIHSSTTGGRVHSAHISSTSRAHTDATSTSITSPAPFKESLPARFLAQLLNTPSMPTNAESNLKKKKGFSLIHAFCRDNDLLLNLVSYLTIPSLISLYAISKPFHYLFNRHPTAFILSIMRTWAPNAGQVYPWRCYQSLCLKDPAKRQKKRFEGKEDQVKHQWDDLRDVPSLKWLQMVVWREGVVKDCLVMLATPGLRCPPGTSDAIKRMWFLMDLPLNSHRIALIQSKDYITNCTLESATVFFLKVDMFLTDPVHPAYPTNHRNQYRWPNKHAGGMPSGVPLRKLLLAERQLTPLWRVLRGWTWDPDLPRLPMTRMDILRLWVRHKYKHPEGTSEKVRKMSIMDIPWYEIGTAGLERAGIAFHKITRNHDGDDQDEDQQAEEKQEHIPIIHPLLSSAGLTSHQNQQLLHKSTLLYPHRRRIVLAHEKPREQLLRPDQLIIRESIRRGLNMHRKWVLMMLYGFVDERTGANLPVWTEEQICEAMRTGRVRGKGGGSEGGKKHVEKGREGGGEPGSGGWTKPPANTSS